MTLSEEDGTTGSASYWLAEKGSVDLDAWVARYSGCVEEGKEEGEEEETHN